MAPGAAVPVDCQIFGLDGPLDLVALRSAVSRLTARHEALRTRVVTVGDHPFQLVDDVWQGAVVTDRAPAGARPEDQLAELASASAGRCSDLAAGPLFAVDLQTFEGDRHLLAIAVHHLVTDGWSMQLLLDELSADYARLLDDPDAAAPAPAVPFGEFAVQQRRALAEEQLSASWSHWTEHLAGAQTSIDLGAGNRPRPIGTLGFSIAPSTVSALRAQAQKHQTTLFTALFAGFAAALTRVSGSADVLIGVPAAGRDSPAFMETVGFFVNLLPIRADLRDDPGGPGLIERVRTALAAGLQFQDLPFAELVRVINPPRKRGVHPLVQVSFQFGERPVETALRLRDVEVAVLTPQPDTTPYAVEVDLVGDGSGGLTGWLTADAAQCDPAVAAELVEVFGDDLVRLGEARSA